MGLHWPLGLTLVLYQSFSGTSLTTSFSGLCLLCPIRMALPYRHFPGALPLRMEPLQCLTEIEVFLATPDESLWELHPQLNLQRGRVGARPASKHSYLPTSPAS